MSSTPPLSDEARRLYERISEELGNRELVVTDDIVTGVVIFLTDFCTSLDIPYEYQELIEYALLVFDKKMSAKDLLYELKSKKDYSLNISAENIISYPNANKNISIFISECVVGNDSGRSASIKFVNTFNVLVKIFRKDIKDHLDGGGREVAALIALTYITTRALKKSGIISKSLSVNKTSSIFEKNSGAVRRILGRLRGSNNNAMHFIENGAADVLTLSELLTQLKGLTAEQ